MARLASTQAGCFSLDQARQLGIPPGQLWRAENSGLLERLHPRVYRFVAVAMSDHSRTWASVLQGGESAVASHEAALRLHGVSRVPFRRAITVPPGINHKHPGIRVHRLGDLIDEHRCTVHGIPTTTIERAVVDVTSVFSRTRLADVVDRITITDRRTSLGGIARAYRQANRRGRYRIRNLGAVLDERRDYGPVPRSKLERHVDELVAATPLPDPLREMPLPGLGDRPGLVDRAWTDARLILEIDGRSWHAREKAMATDRARDRTAGVAGWFTARVLDEEVTERPELVIGDLVGLYLARLGDVGSPVPAGLVPGALLGGV